MKAGKTNAKGQLKSLRQRMSYADLLHRAANTEVRRELRVQHAITRGALMMFVNMGFLQRLRWVLLGMPKGAANAQK